MRRANSAAPVHSWLNRQTLTSRVSRRVDDVEDVVSSSPARSTARVPDAERALINSPRGALRRKDVPLFRRSIRGLY